MPQFHMKEIIFEITEDETEGGFVARALGYSIRSPIDVLLASYCITHGHLLLHRDADFDVMAALRGLQVVRH